MLIQALSQSQMSSLSTRVSERSRRKAEVQAKIAAEYLRLDPVFGEWFFKKWEVLAQSSQDVRSHEFTGLDDYLEFRVVDAATEYDHPF